MWFRARIRKSKGDMETNGGQRYRGAGNKRARPAREGEVRVETGRAPGKKVSDRIGDYVEYEEVEIIEETRDAN